jgi:hypothetical protein
MGAHLMGAHLMGVHPIGVYLTGVHLMTLRPLRLRRRLFKCLDLLLVCESSIKPISIASCFLNVLRRCRFPQPNSGGAMDGGGVR